MSASTPTRDTSPELDQLCINTIRALSIDAVQRAESGHPGLPLGCAPLAYLLWTRFMRHNPHDPKWRGRDRFLLSAGHGSMLLYSLLYLTGYDLPLEELKHFRQWGSKPPGHPAVLEFFKGRIDNVLGILDKRLAGRAYVVGSEPTIADLSLVGYLYYPPEEFGFDVAANYKNIAAWLGRIKALPGWTHPYELMPGYPLPK